MRYTTKTIACCILFAGLAVYTGAGNEQPAGVPAGFISLTTALKLAGANNLDVKIVEEHLAEARADHLIAIEQFLPSVKSGMGFRQHDGNTQTVEGRIIDTNKQLYTGGAALAAQIKLGNAIYETLATHQLVKAAKFATEARRLDSIYQAAVAFYDLVLSHAVVGVSEESVKISQEYALQVGKAAETGLAYQGDALRATAQVQKEELALEQAKVRRRIAAANLSQILNLDPAVELIPDQTTLAPIQLISGKGTLDSLVAKATANRPELKQTEARLQAARSKHDGALYGPTVPSISAEAFWGGLGGGMGNSGAANFDNSSDYIVGASWTVGPGGLFDLGQINKTKAQVKQGVLETEKSRQEIIAQVVASQARISSMANQLHSAQQAMESIEKNLALTRDRKTFGVGEVWENIDAEEQWTKTRLDYLNVLAEYNKSQFAMIRALGLSPSPGSQAPKTSGKTK